MFELANAATQGRLPNKQNFRSPTKTTLISCDDCASQLRKFDSRYPVLEFHFAKSPFFDNSKVSTNVTRNVELEPSRKRSHRPLSICNKGAASPPGTSRSSFSGACGMTHCYEPLGRHRRTVKSRVGNFHQSTSRDRLMASRIFLKGAAHLSL